MVSTAVVRCCCVLVLLFLHVEGFGFNRFPNQRISERKCKEYRDKTKVKTKIIPLTLNPVAIVKERHNCSKTVDLIVGGEAAKPGEFPHQALLGYPNKDDPEDIKFDCGGTLISERFVLTAAHCCAHAYPTVVRLGENSLQTDGENEADFGIEQFIKHPQHKFRAAYNDIALVKLDRDVKLSRWIRPACLWTGPSFNFTEVIATGFGLNETAGDKADVLQKVKLDLLEDNICVDRFGGHGKFPQGVLDSQLCIGSNEGGKDTCQGDSGGPVQVLTDQKGCTFHVVGVTSTSLQGCGIGMSPSIYTRVSSYLDWIEETVWG